MKVRVTLTPLSGFISYCTLIRAVRIGLPSSNSTPIKGCTPQLPRVSSHSHTFLPASTDAYSKTFEQCKSPDICGCSFVSSLGTYPFPLHGASQSFDIEANLVINTDQLLYPTTTNRHHQSSPSLCGSIPELV